MVFDPETIGHAGSELEPGVAVTGLVTVVLGGEPVFDGRRLGRVVRG